MVLPVPMETKDFVTSNIITSSHYYLYIVRILHDYNLILISISSIFPTTQFAATTRMFERNGPH